MTDYITRALLPALVFPLVLVSAASAINTSILLLPPGQTTEVPVVTNSSTSRLSRPRINDLGEVVWSLRESTSVGNVYSNLRGQITTNVLAREPDINNLGEIVWRFGDGGQEPNGIGTNVRGTVLLSTGIDPYYDTPRINNSGEIIAGRSGNPGRVWSSIRGNFASSANTFVRETELNDLGEVVYDGNNHVYSTVRGAISPAPFFARNPDINILGEIVWQQSSTLDQTTAWEIWSNTRGKLGDGESPAINDSGEVVWHHRNGSAFNIYSSIRGQITSSPYDNRFAHINNSGAITWFREEPVVPEPSAALLIGFAVTALTLLRPRIEAHR